MELKLCRSAPKFICTSGCGVEARLAPLGVAPTPEAILCQKSLAPTCTTSVGAEPRGQMTNKIVLPGADEANIGKYHATLQLCHVKISFSFLGNTSKAYHMFYRR
jgi:hypothetical protein